MGISKAFPSAASPALTVGVTLAVDLCPDSEFDSLSIVPRGSITLWDYAPIAISGSNMIAFDLEPFELSVAKSMPSFLVKLFEAGEQYDDSIYIYTYIYIYIYI